jgi:hypothetical protein
VAQQDKLQALSTAALIGHPQETQSAQHRPLRKQIAAAELENKPAPKTVAPYLTGRHPKPKCAKANPLLKPITAAERASV